MSPNESSSQPQVRWDTSALQEVSDINFCNVATATDALTLIFGSSEAYTGQDVLTVRLRNRVVLRPLAAKLLRDLLNQQIGAFEAAHGAIASGYQALPGSTPMQLPSAPGPLLPSTLPERGALMVELVKDLQVPLEIERSCKLRHGALLPHRFLLGINKAALGASATIRLPVILKRLGMPETLSLHARAGLATADFVHFGFEEDPNGATLKFYVEQSGPLAEALAGRTSADTVPLYTGYKWDPADSGRHAVSHYVAHPLLSVEGIMNRMAALLPKDEGSAVLGICTDLLALAAERAESRNLLYVDVTESGNARASFDLNLYAARLQMREIYPFLATAARHFALPRESFRAFYEESREHTLGHVSAGLDREGQSFLTFYFGDRTNRA